MTISMQGSWTVSVKSESASWPQRFQIKGSTNGVDGIYTGAISTSPITVTGDQWGITVEHDPPIGSWTHSKHRLANFSGSVGHFDMDIQTDDTAGDLDYNDLILTCATVLTEFEYVVYGSVKTYTGLCPVNPCYPKEYYVIDDYNQLKNLFGYAPVRSLLEKLYPERTKVRKWRQFPDGEYEPFRPMMFPSKAVIPSMLEVADSPAFAKIEDLVSAYPCIISPVTETVLQFIEYDRTDAEKEGNPYTGEGNRTILGITWTDEQGNYVFRFSQTLTEIVEEAGDKSESEEPLTQIRPDLIIQIIESLPDGIAFESAPYYNIPNVKRIDLCVPEVKVPKPYPCQEGPAIQAIGDLVIVDENVTLHDDGTITNTIANGPKVERAAWYDTLDLRACFLDTDPEVEFYTIRYKRDSDSDWLFMDQPLKHSKKQEDGSIIEDDVGPKPRELRINGLANPKVYVNSYLNIENEEEWIQTHNDRKMWIITSKYQSVAGKVEFKIEGYDEDGEKVDGAEDEILLYIDNHFSEGMIDSVKLGTEDPGECALFDLPNADEALTVKYKVTDTEGFMKNYALNVWRGSNVPLPTIYNNTNKPVAFKYLNVPPYHDTDQVQFPNWQSTNFRFHGTKDQTNDPNNYVEVLIKPKTNNWLEDDMPFCAFLFVLTALDRLTNGKTTPSTRILWRELIGIRYEAP